MVESEGEVKRTGAIQTCGIVGLCIGVATALWLIWNTDLARGGVIGGAISGLIGAVAGQGLGRALGSSIFGRK